MGNVKREFVKTAISAASVCLLCGGMAMAQQGGMSQPGGGQAPVQSQQNHMSPMDQAQNGAVDPMQINNDNLFVRNAIQGGRAEVELGKLAVQKGSSDQVKQFGQRMIDDHTKMGEALQQAATQMKVKVPDGIPGKDKKLEAKLQALSGPDFDREYVKAMVKDHKDDKNDFSVEAQNAANPGLKDLAAKGLTVITQHLAMIEEIAKSNTVASK